MSALSPAGAEGEDGYSIPWVARLEYGGFDLLQAPPDAPGEDGYQWQLRHGVTIQPWRIILFHAGWDYRETLAPGFTRPYREPFNLQASATVEVLPDFVYAWFGMGWPMRQSTIPPSDSSAWDGFLSEHSTLPDAGILNPASIQGGGLVRFGLDPALVLAGMSYQLPSDYAQFEGRRFRPPWLLRMKLEIQWPWSGSGQSVEGIATLYGYELTREKHEAHREAPWLQFRYSATGLGEGGLWAATIGISGKWKDENREVLLDIPPPTSEDNGNLQRFYFEAARFLKSSPWSIHFAVANRIEAQWRPSDGRVYLENTLSFRNLWRVFQTHGLELHWRGLIGETEGRPYFGAGVSGVFTFRHLGQNMFSGPSESQP